jgi:AcrR family transcriptional regulator
MRGSASPDGQRTLSPTQAATRARVLAATVELAASAGYDGFTMRDVAAAAGVSPATAYLYYGSKDEALVDALVENGMRTSDAVGRHRPGDERPLDTRVVDAFTKVVRAYQRAPLLYRAMFRAYVSRVPGDTPATESPWSGRSWLDRAVGDDLPDRDIVVEVLQSLVLSSMISLVVGSSASDVLVRFEREVAHVLDGRGRRRPTR